MTRSDSPSRLTAHLQISLDRLALEAIFDLPGNDGSFSAEQMAYLAAQGQRRTTVLLAFPPKAAGTFLRAAVVNVTGGDVLRVCYAQGDRDAQPYMPTFLAYYAGAFGDRPMVTHVHMQAFPANTAFLEAFGIRPVLMVRSIPDMLASYWDMLEDGGNGLPMGLNCTIPPHFRTMAAESRAEFLIELIAPWYAGYYATWSRYLEARPGAALLVHYSDFVSQPAKTLSQILESSGLNASPERCQEAIEAIWTERHMHRFSEGVEGRGQAYFTASQIERIDRLLSYYPSTQPFRAVLLGL